MKPTLFIKSMLMVGAASMFLIGAPTVHADTTTPSTTQSAGGDKSAEIQKLETKIQKIQGKIDSGKLTGDKLTKKQAKLAKLQAKLAKLQA